jgi:hypothetical protein
MEWIRDTGKSTAHLGDGKRRWRGEGVVKDYGWGYAYSSARSDTTIIAQRTIQLQSIGVTYRHE